jgi:hypothetical protein
MKPSRLVTSGGVRRPTVRGMRKITKAALLGGVAAAAIAATAGIGLATSGTANAFPGFCPGGGGGYGGFGYCDGPSYLDGSYDHTVMIFGGWQASRVCPPDPANPAIPLAWVPGQTCQFRK